MSRFILILLAINSFTSCNSKNEKLLCKRWQVADVIFIDDETKLAQNDSLQLNMLRTQRIILKDVLMKNLYEFHDDGTYITGNAAAASSGEWDLRGNSIMFKTNSSGDVKSANKTIPFEHLSADSLILLLNNDQTTVKMKLLLIPVE